MEHDQKAALLCRLRDQHGLHELVETGTGYGALIEKVAGQFKQIYSIESDLEHFICAQERVGHWSHVHLFHGDSATWVRDLLTSHDQATLIFLDAHWDGDPREAIGDVTPVLNELRHIFHDRRNHVIVVDDWRLFGEWPGYPTKDAVRALADDHRYTPTQEGDCLVLI